MFIRVRGCVMMVTTRAWRSVSPALPISGVCLDSRPAAQATLLADLIQSTVISACVQLGITSRVTFHALTVWTAHAPSASAVHTALEEHGGELYRVVLTIHRPPVPAPLVRASVCLGIKLLMEDANYAVPVKFAWVETPLLVLAIQAPPQVPLPSPAAPVGLASPGSMEDYALYVLKDSTAPTPLFGLHALQVLFARLVALFR